MKKTFKNIRTLAALLMAGAAFAACSSDDSIIENQQPANPSEQVYTLTLEATNGDANTRALGFDGTALKATWAVGDVLYVVKGTTPVGTLSVKAGTISVDGKSATFTGTVAGVSVNDELTLTYHPITSVSDFESQDGTLKGTKGAEKYDMATATVTVETVNAGKITIHETEASFTTKTAMIKLTLTDGTNALNATSLNVKATITLNPYVTISEDVLTFTIPAGTYTTNGDGILYYALPSQATVASQLAAKYSSYGITESSAAALLTTATITFTATVGGTNYAVNKTGYKFVAGKYYKATLTMAPAATGHELSASVVGDVVGTDGLAYDVSDKNNLPTGVTAAGMVAYKSGSNGLVIALADEASTMNWSTANGASGAAAHTPTVSGKAWQLPSLAEWQQMFIANGGNAGSYTGLNTTLAAAGGDSSKLQDVYYWSSTESGGDRAYFVNLDDGDAEFPHELKGNPYRVRACLAF